MTRIDVQQGEIAIAYGHDVSNGYFLAVYDARLRRSEHNSDELNAVCEGASPSGSGGYFFAYAGPIGFGTRVSISTMRELWCKYGVSEEGLKMLSENL